MNDGSFLPRLTRRRTLAGLAASPLVAACARSGKSDKPPNILFLLADDLRWDALGVTGNKIVQTPTIDALGARGAVFSRAYVTTSICPTSRASIFTGQYARRHGIWDFTSVLTSEQ
ncbi:MAG: sulfatase-like hydrolase/transferase, partial [Amphiplicatus sp.]